MKHNTILNNCMATLLLHIWLSLQLENSAQNLKFLRFKATRQKKVTGSLRKKRKQPKNSTVMVFSINSASAISMLPILHNFKKRESG